MAPDVPLRWRTFQPHWKPVLPTPSTRSGFGIFAPAKTPRDIIEKLHRETIKALQAPKVADKLSGLGVDPMVMPPAEFGKR
jgi:tripartite-type tricarboxylate transporter receptor subunit TctC